MAPSLCENCHKRPKFGTHKFCGKTCAAQAAAKPTKPKPSQPRSKAGPTTAGRHKAPAPQKAAAQLCIYCGQKPKFNNFDYCGKTCAALAGGAQTKPSAAQAGSGTKQKATRVPYAAPKNVPAPQAPRAAKAPHAKAPVPQYDSTEDEEFEEDDEEDGGFSTDLDAYPSESESEEEQGTPAVAAAKPVIKVASRASKQSGTPKAPAGTCVIPGCGQACHVDRNGVKTSYCSMKHREEAVKRGLEEACIMCQRYPQSNSDYFCSSACRNQSMTKT